MVPMPMDQDSDIHRTQRSPPADGEPLHVMEVIREICSRLPTEVPRWDLPRQPTAFERLLEALAPRHRDATLENFIPPNEEAQAAVAELKRYAANLDGKIATGTGILLYGPSGTGKDHLLAALAKMAAAAGHYVKRITGPELFRMMRDAMSDGEETSRLDSLKYPRILVLSDPVPPLGGLTPYQAAVLYEVIDHRWQHKLCTWCSLNVASSQEADQRLGAAIVDRLHDGALVIRCFWPSYRRPWQSLNQRK